MRPTPRVRFERPAANHVQTPGALKASQRGKKDKVRFFNISQGSVEESRYYLILTRDLRYAETAMLSTKLREVSCLLERYYNAVMVSVR